MTFIKNSSIDYPLSPFDELSVVERTNLIELRSQTNIVSALKNITSTTGGGSITVTNSEFHLTTGTSASDAATLDSAERGRYMPGYGAECGIAIRLDGTTYDSDSESRWGFFDDLDGFGFGKDATGLFVFVRNNGSETAKVYQSNWSVDSLDGNGASGLTLDDTRGNIFQIVYSWYGYGVAQFKVVMPDSNAFNGQRVVTVHTYVPSGTTSIRQPNLPIRAKINNGSSTTARTMHVAGRQYSILGRYSPNRRLITHTRTAQTLTATAGFEHVMSFRRKNSADYKSISIKLGFVNSIISQNAIARIKTNATITSPSWINPSGRSGNPSETAMEVTTAGTVSGGIILGEFLISGSRSSPDLRAITAEDFFFDLIELEPITLEIDTLANASATTIFALREEW